MIRPRTLKAIGLAVIAFATATSGCGHVGDAPSQTAAPMPTVQVIAAARGTLTRSLPATGTLSTLPNAEAALSPQVSGTLRSLPVQFGQIVQAGEVVAQISPQQLMGQIQQAQATYESDLIQVDQAQANALQQEAQTRTNILQAQANLRNAQASLAAASAMLTGDVAAQTNAQQSAEREEKLYTGGLVAERDLEDAQLTLQTAGAAVAAQKETVEGQRQIVAGMQAALEAAQTGSLVDTVKRKDIQVARQQSANARGALESIRSQLSLYTIRSPLAGTITQIGPAVGESVDPTTKLVTISNLDRLQLQVGAPDSMARTVQVGDEIEFQADSIPGHTFQTTVETVSPQVDPASGAVPVVAIVPNQRHLLKDDMTVAVQIVTARHANAIIVPKSAVLTDPDSGAKSVMVVGADSIAHVVTVQTGIESNGCIEILTGIRPGQKVAVDGQYGIADGSSVHAELEQNSANTSGASSDGS